MRGRAFKDVIIIDYCSRNVDKILTGKIAAACDKITVKSIYIKQFRLVLILFYCFGYGDGKMR